jgi:hypothetical protein
VKLIFASLLVFSLIILFLFALFPSDISVTRVVQINKPRAEVRYKIADLREWKSWNDFLYKAYGNRSVSWAGGKEDSIHIERPYIRVDLLKTTPDSVITRWEQDKKYFTGNFILTEMSGQTVLEWTLYFHVKWYPWEKLASMFYDKQLGPLMENSLIKLRNELETH